MHGHSFYFDDDTHAACVMCVQLSLCVESEITSLISPALSNFPLFPTKSTQSPVNWIRILLDDDYSKKWSLSKHFSSGAYLPYVDLLHARATRYTQHVTRNTLHATSYVQSVIPIYLTESECSNYWFAKNCRAYEIWGLKMALEAIS